jgi:hypothetical protein
MPNSPPARRLVDLNAARAVLNRFLGLLPEPEDLSAFGIAAEATGAMTLRLIETAEQLQARVDGTPMPGSSSPRRVRPPIDLESAKGVLREYTRLLGRQPKSQFSDSAIELGTIARRLIRMIERLRDQFDEDDPTPGELYERLVTALLAKVGPVAITEDDLKNAPDPSALVMVNRTATAWVADDTPTVFALRDHHFDNDGNLITPTIAGRLGITVAELRGPAERHEPLSAAANTGSPMPLKEAMDAAALALVNSDYADLVPLEFVAPVVALFVKAIWPLAYKAGRVGAVAQADVQDDEPLERHGGSGGRSG